MLPTVVSRPEFSDIHTLFINEVVYFPIWRKSCSNIKSPEKNILQSILKKLYFVYFHVLAVDIQKWIHNFKFKIIAITMWNFIEIYCCSSTSKLKPDYLSYFVRHIVYVPCSSTYLGVYEYLCILKAKRKTQKKKLDRIVYHPNARNIEQALFVCNYCLCPLQHAVHTVCVYVVGTTSFVRKWAPFLDEARIRIEALLCHIITV